MKHLYNISFMLAIISSCFILSYTPLLKKGDKAPHFKLLDQDNNPTTLDQFKGKKIALYFYPKSDTPGCNAQSCSLRDMDGVLKRNNIITIGVTYDSPQVLKAFKHKHNLPFILLSDNTKEVSQKYGTYQEHYPHVPGRVTFLINEDGTIHDVLDNITVSMHGQEVLNAFGVPQEAQKP